MADAPESYARARALAAEQHVEATTLQGDVVPADAELVVWLGRKPRDELARSVVEHVRRGGALLAALEPDALHPDLMKELGLVARKPRVFPLQAAKVDGAPTLLRAVQQPRPLDLVLDGCAAIQLLPDADADLRTGALVKPVFLDENGDGKQDANESEESISAAASLDGPTTRRAFLISDADVFTTASLEKNPPHAELLSERLGWLARSIEKRRMMSAPLRPKPGDACTDPFPLCASGGAATVACRGGILAEDLRCAGPKACRETTDRSRCDDPRVDIVKLLDHDLPAGLVRAKAEAQGIGAKIQLTLTGDPGGDWFLDMTAPKVTRGKSADAQCTIEIASADVPRLVEASEVMALFFSGKMRITGAQERCMLAAKILALRNR